MFGSMSWRRFHLVLCLLMAFIAVMRAMTGNIIGAVVPAVLAVVFGSVAFDYPLIKRVRQLWALFRRRRDKPDA